MNVSHLQYFTVCVLGRGAVSLRPASYPCRDGPPITNDLGARLVCLNIAWVKYIDVVRVMPISLGAAKARFASSWRRSDNQLAKP